MFIYVNATWLVANLLHPVMLVIVFNWESPFDLISLEFAFLFILYSLICSMPSVAMSHLVMYSIFKLPLHNTGKYITWLLIAPVIVICNYWFLTLLATGVIGDLSLEMMLPAMLSVIATILIRFTNFFKAANELDRIRKEKELKNNHVSYQDK